MKGALQISTKTSDKEVGEH